MILKWLKHIFAFALGAWGSLPGKDGGRVVASPVSDGSALDSRASRGVAAAVFVDLVRIGQISKNYLSELGYFRGFLSKTAGYLQMLSHDQQAIVEEIKHATVRSDELLKDVSGRLEKMRSSSEEAEILVAQGSESIKEMGRAAESIEKLGADLEEIDKATSDIFRHLDSLGEIALSTKLITMNLHIEAARLGQSGQGVAVIAEHMTTFSKAVEETNRSISKSLRAGMGRIHDIKGEMRDRLGVTTAAIEVSTDHVEKIIDKVVELRSHVTSIVEVVGQQVVMARELVETQEKIVKTTTSLGTASANVQMAQINLGEVAGVLESLDLRRGLCLGDWHDALGGGASAGLEIKESEINVRPKESSGKNTFVTVAA